MSGTPTVYPAANFNSEEDARALKQAFDGFGSKKADAIIDIITHRSNEQRQQIAARFKTMYGKDLMKELRRELGAPFQDVIIALMTDPIEFQAKQLHKAVSNLGIDEAKIVEIFSVHNNKDVVKISQAYEELYQQSLEGDIKGDTSGNTSDTVKRILVSLTKGHRDESEEIDKEKAFKDAQNLLRLGELIQGTEESVFNEILCQRNRSQIRLIFDEYEKITGHPFEKGIKNEFSWASRKTPLALIHSIRNKVDYLATRVYESMARVSIDEHTLIRIIVSRSEVDLQDIKELFQQKYDKTLADSVRDYCWRDYKECLLAIIA